MKFIVDFMQLPMIYSDVDPIILPRISQGLKLLIKLPISVSSYHVVCWFQFSSKKNSIILYSFYERRETYEDMHCAMKEILVDVSGALS
jgi:hypothetical protein